MKVNSASNSYHKHLKHQWFLHLGLFMDFIWHESYWSTCVIRKSNRDTIDFDFDSMTCFKISTLSLQIQVGLLELALGSSLDQHVRSPEVLGKLLRYRSSLIVGLGSGHIKWSFWNAVDLCLGGQWVDKSFIQVE